MSFIFITYIVKTIHNFKRKTEKINNEEIFQQQEKCQKIKEKKGNVLTDVNKK